MYCWSVSKYLNSTRQQHLMKNQVYLQVFWVQGCSWFSSDEGKQGETYRVRQHWIGQGYKYTKKYYSFECIIGSLTALWLECGYTQPRSVMARSSPYYSNTFIQLVKLRVRSLMLCLELNPAGFCLDAWPRQLFESEFQFNVISLTLNQLNCRSWI